MRGDIFTHLHPLLQTLYMLQTTDEGPLRVWVQGGERGTIGARSSHGIQEDDPCEENGVKYELANVTT